MDKVSAARCLDCKSPSYLFKATPVLLSILGWYRFIGEWHGGKLVLIVMISDIFDIFEDRVQVLHSLDIEKTDLGDESLQI